GPGSDRQARRADTRLERETPDAARRRGGGGQSRHVSHLAGGDDRSGHRNPHRRAGRRGGRQRQLPTRHDQRPCPGDARGIRRQRPDVRHDRASGAGEKIMSGNGNGGAFELRRIVIAIDSSIPAAAGLEAVAALAARLPAELEGVFVEDADLARLAELPVAREICFAGGVRRDFTADTLAAQYREQALVARRAIAAAAAKSRIAYAF